MRSFRPVSCQLRDQHLQAGKTPFDGTAAVVQPAVVEDKHFLFHNSIGQNQLILFFIQALLPPGLTTPFFSKGLAGRCNRKSEEFY